MFNLNLDDINHAIQGYNSVFDEEQERASLIRCTDIQSLRIAAADAWGKLCSAAAVKSSAEILTYLSAQAIGATDTLFLAAIESAAEEMGVPYRRELASLVRTEIEIPYEGNPTERAYFQLEHATQKYLFALELLQKSAN